MGASKPAKAKRKVGLRFWLAGLVTLGNAVVAMAFAAVGVIEPSKIERDGAMGGAAHVFAMYVAARSLPLVLAILGSIAVRSRPALRALAFLAAGIQACDAVVGALGGYPMKTFGPAVLAAGTLAAAVFWLRPPRPA